MLIAYESSNNRNPHMKKILVSTFIALAPIVSIVGVFATAATIAHADEARFDFSSRKAADASYARVFGQLSPAGSRAFLRDVKKLVIVQFSPDGTVSGGRKAIERKKPTADQYFAAMARALGGKTAAEVVAEAEKIRD
jgi:hypothetical protein